jgi:FlaA1/EpsC-like NDP-sugar epimerase
MKNIKNISALRVLTQSAIISISWLLAYFIRFDLGIPSKYLHSLVVTSSVVFFVSFVVLIFRRDYRNIWKYTSVVNVKNDIINIISIYIISTILFFYIRVDPAVPRTVNFIAFLMAGFQVIGLKLIIRYHYFNNINLNKNNDVLSLIIGAGERGRRVSLELIKREAVVGFIDDDFKKHNKRINDINVLGSLSNIDFFIKNLGINKVYLAIKDIPLEKIDFILDVCSARKVEIDVSTYDNFSDDRAVNFKKLDIEYLLGREPANIDIEELKSFIEGKTIFISGAGGSIGSEICRQLVRLNPKKIIAFDLSEYAIYALSENIDKLGVKTNIRYLVGDITNNQLIDSLFQKYRPEVVYHAAAYKHVPLLENDNSWSGIYNNVFGTYSLSKTSIKHGVENFVLISTDKAVEPTNVMGATKRVSEIICSSFNNHGSTVFNIVRFGNVIGSSGSVIPKFIDQIKFGGPITITHPDVTRYFMSIPEAAKLVIHASSMRISDAIFILDMGKPIKIKDIAHNLIKFFNMRDIQITYTGLRPGEKLHEALVDQGKILNETHNIKIKYQKLNHESLRSHKCDISLLVSQINPLDDELNRTELFKFIEIYNHG